MVMIIKQFVIVTVLSMYSTSRVLYSSMTFASLITDRCVCMSSEVYMYNQNVHLDLRSRYSLHT